MLTSQDLTVGSESLRRVCCNPQYALTLSKKIIPIEPFTRKIMNFAKSTRTRFTIAKKIEVLDLVKDGKARTETCRKFSLASSTLLQFIKDEKKIRDEFENKAQQANNASMGILSTISTLSTPSAPSTFSNVDVGLP